MSIFSEKNYKRIIVARLGENKKIRGYQRSMAEAAGCQPSFLSQVAHSHVHLTPDQAAGLCLFWNLGEDESEYFMTLVHLARCSSRNYRQMLEEKVRVLREKHHDLSKVREGWQLTQATYYSAWYFTAIHVLVSIPEFNTPAKIAAKLGLTETLVRESLQSLANMGLVREKAGRWSVTTQNVHLPRSSPLTAANHANWRQYVLMKLQENRKEDIHYSAVYAVSEDDYQRIKDVVVKMIADAAQIVGPSKEETLCCLFVDSFQIG